MQRWRWAFRERKLLQLRRIGQERFYGRGGGDRRVQLYRVEDQGVQFVRLDKGQEWFYLIGYLYFKYQFIFFREVGVFAFWRQQELQKEIEVQERVSFWFSFDFFRLVLFRDGFVFFFWSFLKMGFGDVLVRVLGFGIELIFNKKLLLNELKNK